MREDLLPNESELAALRRRGFAVRALQARIEAAGIRIGGVSLAADGSVRVTPHPEGPPTANEQQTIDALIAGLDVEAEANAAEAETAAAESEVQDFCGKIAARRARIAEDLAAVDAAPMAELRNILKRMLTAEAAHLKFHAFQLRARAD